jgi:hypothetical protein
MDRQTFEQDGRTRDGRHPRHGEPVAARLRSLGSRHRLEHCAGPPTRARDGRARAVGAAGAPVCQRATNPSSQCTVYSPRWNSASSTMR